MARTANVFARVEPEVKEQAEQVLDRLGIPMSNAVGMFLRQIVLPVSYTHLDVYKRQYESFVGWDANVILEEVMNTSSVNQDIKRMIDEMYKCIEDKKYDEAEKIVDILDKKTNGYAAVSYTHLN